MTQITARVIIHVEPNPGVQSQVGLRRHHYEQSQWRWWNLAESPMDCKEIKTVISEGNQSWIFILKTDSEAAAWQAAVHGVAQTWTWLNDWTIANIYVPKVKSKYTQYQNSKLFIYMQSKSSQFLLYFNTNKFNNQKEKQNRNILQNKTSYTHKHIQWI